MKKFILLAILTFLCFTNIRAQIEATDNVVGTNHILHSEILTEDRQIQIYLPEGYDESKQQYPVVYILDGQRFFLHTVGLTA